MAKVPPQQSKDKAQPSLHPGALRLKASRGMVLLLVVLPALLVFGAGYFGFWLRRGNAVAAAKVPTVRDESSLPAGLRAGPWGLLESQATFLRIPDECLKDFKPATAPRWVFKVHSMQQVLGFFASAGLSDDKLVVLSDPKLWEVQAQQVVLRPPHSLILGLSPSERSVIYTTLAQSPENVMQHAPFFWKTKDEAELFSQPAFSEQSRALVQRLTYRKGNLSLFADIEALANELSASGSDVGKLLKELSRKPIVLPKLRITPETDVNAMMRYWGVAGLHKTMRPALEAVSRIPAGRTVSFLAVLPPFARQRVNTYPVATDHDNMDGLWSAMNFFNERPMSGPVDPSHWNQRFISDYFTVFADPRYGDILVISRPGGEVLQAGVYLADDLVFTRLGATRWEPWAIMTVSDLLEVSNVRSPGQERPVISYYRNRIL